MLIAQLPQTFIPCVILLSAVLIGLILIEELPQSAQRFLKFNLKKFWVKKK